MTPREKGIIAAVTFVFAVSAALLVTGIMVYVGISAIINGFVLLGIADLLLSLPLGALVGTFWATAAFLVKR